MRRGRGRALPAAAAWSRRRGSPGQPLARHPTRPRRCEGFFLPIVGTSSATLFSKMHARHSNLASAINSPSVDRSLDCKTSTVKCDFSVRPILQSSFLRRPTAAMGACSRPEPGGSVTPEVDGAPPRQQSGRHCIPWHSLFFHALSPPSLPLSSLFLLAHHAPQPGTACTCEPPSPSRRSPTCLTGVLHSRVISCCSALWSTCSPLGLLLWEVSHRYPVVDGTRPGVAMVVGHAKCALQYAAAVVERADHVPYALPPCHSTAVPQRAGTLPDHLRSPVPLGRPQGGKPAFFSSGSPLGRPQGRETLLSF